MNKTKTLITEEMLLTGLIHGRGVIQKGAPGAFEINPGLQHLDKLQPSILLLAAKLLDEFVNTENFVKIEDLKAQSDTVAERLGTYFGRVNNLMWMSVFVLERPLSVFLLERPESANYEDMYETFYILTGCHEGAKYFIDIFHNMDRLIVVGAPKQKWEF